VFLLLKVTSLPLKPKEAPTGRRSHLGGTVNAKGWTEGAAAERAASNGSSEIGTLADVSPVDSSGLPWIENTLI